MTCTAERPPSALTLSSDSHYSQELSTYCPSDSSSRHAHALSVISEGSYASSSEPLQYLEKPLPPVPISFLQSSFFPDPTPDLAPLPPSLLQECFKYLSDQSELARLLCVNTTFYRAGVELLYQRIRLRTDRPWPTFTADWSSNKLSIASTVQLFCRQYTLDRSWLVNVVRIVDLYAHSTRICLPDKEFGLVTVASLPALPNLKVLRVHMTDSLCLTQSQRTLHNTLEQQAANDLCPHIHLSPQCPAVFRLRPTKVVVIGGPCVYPELQLTALPYGPLASVKKYVLILSPSADLISSEPRNQAPVVTARGISADIFNVANAEDLTIIFYTPGPDLEWGGPMETDYHARRMRDTWAGQLFTELARCLAPLPWWQKLCIVNAGAIDRNGAGMSYWDHDDGMEAIEHHFRSELYRYRAPPRRSSLSDRRMSVKCWVPGATVTFMSMPEYLAIADCEDEFEHHEIEAWLPLADEWAYASIGHGLTALTLDFDDQSSLGDPQDWNTTRWLME